jgi:hypothetical protein
MHEGYVKLGLFADWRDGWQVKPAYWVYVNYYTYLHDTEMISATAPSGTLAMAGRRAATGTLAVWLTNGELEKQGNLTFQINDWPTDGAVVTTFDNLAGPDPVVAYRLAADGQLTFEYAVPPRTSFLFVIRSQSVP